LTNNNLKLAEEYVEKVERVQAGQPIIDFTQNDVDGNPVTLSQIAEGKLLLVDFWASWCPDCRKENPNVVAAWQKYHEQGFDILGVSFDTNKEAWLAAIEKDNLTWTHVSDLQGPGPTSATCKAGAMPLEPYTASPSSRKMPSSRTA